MSIPSAQSRTAPRLLFVINVDWFFASHRLPIALAALRCGYDVHIACVDTGRCDELEALGLTVHRMPVARSDNSPGGLFALLRWLLGLFRCIRPDVVHLVTIRPVLFGGIAARLARVPGRVAAISGLGPVFTERGLRAGVRRILVRVLYRIALGRGRLRVIFQNEDDRRCLVGIGACRFTDTVLIPGSGVDLKRYAISPLPAVPAALLAARLLREKGVLEFIEAAARIRATGATAFRFVLVGDVDPDSPGSLDRRTVAAKCEQAGVEWLGQRDDMAEVMAQATVVVLPSYYGEGMPKVLLEAAACGRPVITTDHPGCRDAIEPGVSGMLVPPRDPEALAAELSALLADRLRCEAMGRAGRNRAERLFDLQFAVEHHLELYEVVRRAEQSD